MDLTLLIVGASSIAAVLAVMLIFAAGWIAAGRLGPAAERTMARHPIDAPSRVRMADIRQRLRRLETIEAEFEV